MMDSVEPKQDLEPVTDDTSLSKRKTSRSSAAWRASHPLPTVRHHLIDAETLRANVHLPIEEAAKKLGVCVTVMKKICRKNGIARWPHRKIASLEKTIADLEAINKSDPIQAAHIQEKLSATIVARDDLVFNRNQPTPKSSKSRRTQRKRLPRRAAAKERDEQEWYEYDDQELFVSAKRDNVSPRQQVNAIGDLQDYSSSATKPPRVSHLSLLQPSTVHSPPNLSREGQAETFLVPMTTPHYIASPSTTVTLMPSGPSFGTPRDSFSVSNLMVPSPLHGFPNFPWVQPTDATYSGVNYDQRMLSPQYGIHFPSNGFVTNVLEHQR